MEFQKRKLRFVEGWDMRWKIFRISLGHGDVWIGVPVWCYTECNRAMRPLARTWSSQAPGGTEFREVKDLGGAGVQKFGGE